MYSRYNTVPILHHICSEKYLTYLLVYTVCNLDHYGLTQTLPLPLARLRSSHKSVMFSSASSLLLISLELTTICTADIISLTGSEVNSPIAADNHALCWNKNKHIEFLVMTQLQWYLWSVVVRPSRWRWPITSTSSLAHESCHNDLDLGERDST